MSITSSKPGAFITGTLIGGLVGATVALLYAPRSGQETRTVIKEKSLELKDKAVETGEELRHKAQDFADQTKARIEETADATKEKAIDLQHRGQAFIDKQREQIQRAIQSGKKSMTQPEEAVLENGMQETTPAS